MSHARHSDESERSASELEEAADLRAAIRDSLLRLPANNQGLRNNVWNYVRSERDAGATPAEVIRELTDLVASVGVPSSPRRRALERDVILWCVEAYFGQLGEPGADPQSAGTDARGPRGSAGG